MKNTAKGVLAGIAIAPTASACGSSTAATPAHNYVDIHDGGGYFLLAYMDYLQGNSAMPKDTCQAHTVEQLFRGCDEGGHWWTTRSPTTTSRRAKR